jgi:hypothetical protein
LNEFRVGEGLWQYKEFPMNRIRLLFVAICCLVPSFVLSLGGAERGAGVAEHSVAVISGTPRERGRQYGQKFTREIRDFLEKEIYGRYTARPQHPKDRILAYARQCTAAVKDFSPIIMEEMQGMAEGSGLKLEELVLIALHEELWLGGILPKVEHCTPFALGPPLTKDGKTYVGQTWDWMASVRGQSSVLHWKRAEGPSVLAYAYPGLWVSAGMNDAGLALCWVTGPGYGKGPRVGVPAYVMVAHLLYQNSLDQALAEIRRDKHAGTFRFVLADATGRQAVVSCSPAKTDITVHKSQSDPTGRLTKHFAAAKDGLDLDGMKAALGRVSYGSGPGRRTITVDAMIFNTVDRVAYLTRGPDLGPWARFAFDRK